LRWGPGHCPFMSPFSPYSTDTVNNFVIDTATNLALPETTRSRNMAQWQEYARERIMPALFLSHLAENRHKS